ncbi:UNVERIFIED_CONTAM: hypothetical protein K2H54_050875 [Gekko kuhli]
MFIFYIDKDPIVAPTSVTLISCKKGSVSELGAAGKSGEVLKKTYLFREEFFNVFKPHIAADFQKELQQGSSEAGLEEKGSEQQEGAKSGESHSEAAKKKRKRRRSVLNYGEHDALEYHLKPLLNYNKKFDVIVIDPPWENKSVKRSNRYSYLPPWQIKQIPVPALAAPDCLVVTWVTNRQKHLRFVKDELYPHWAVHGVVEWYWVKITRSGEFVFPLESSHKKPYEILVLGKIQGSTDTPLRSGDEAVPIPDHKLINFRHILFGFGILLVQIKMLLPAKMFITLEL